MGLKNIVLGAIASGILAASAHADEIYLKKTMPVAGKGYDMIEGEITKETDTEIELDCAIEVQGELKSAGITIPKQNIEKIVKKPYERGKAANARMEKREPILKVRRMAQEFKDSAPVLAKQAAEIVKKSIEDGKANYIYAYNDWLFAIDFDKDVKGNATIKRAYENHSILPALLEIGDLRKLTRYPNLEASLNGDSVNFKINDSKDLTIRTARMSDKKVFDYIEVDDGKHRIFVTEPHFDDLKNKLGLAASELVHPTKEFLGKYSFPKKVVLSKAIGAPHLETIDYRHYAIPELWDSACGTLLGKIQIGNTDFFVSDRFAPEMIVKEYYPLRQKSEEEKRKFTEQFKGNFQKKAVKIGSKDFFYVGTEKEELENCQKTAEQIAKTNLYEVCGKNEKIIFKDYLFTQNYSEDVELMVKNSKTIEDLVNSIETMMKKKQYNRNVSAGMFASLDQLAKNKQYDCESYATITANAFRKAGVPALINYIYPQNQIPHAIAEIYLPNQDLVIYIDYLKGEQAYIFKPSSKDIFNCKFDAKIFGNNREANLAEYYVDKTAIAQKKDEAHNREMKHTEESRKILGYFEKPKE